MSRSASLSNKLVMNKYLWMSHQLRHFNDVASIINWSNAMTLVKGLLLEPLPAAPTPIKPIPASAPRPQSQPLFLISNPYKSTTNIPPVPTSNHDARSITPPTTISFKPKKTMPLTQSLLRCSSYLPRKPSPLTTYTLSNPAISSSDSLPRQPKRRKLAIPPSVDYNAPANPRTQSNGTPGTHNLLRAHCTQKTSVKSAVLEILEEKLKRQGIHWGDMLTPYWARLLVEKRLRMPKYSLLPYKEIVVQAANEFYTSHGKKIPQWVDK